MVTTVDFSVLLGKTILDIKGLELGNDIVYFYCSDGTSYRMMHHQDCCENVTIEDIIGDVPDIIGSEIIRAEEVSGNTPNDYKFVYEPESYTWTFYKLDTIKGGITIRWLGESNGYYSEEVYFEEITDER